jgi:hypothetical protein
VTSANPPPARPLAEGDRQVLQGLLGEHHGLLTTIIQELLSSSLDIAPLSSLDPEIRELLDDLSNAFPRVSVAFGEAQGALNTGNHDDGLSGAGLTAEQLEPKKRAHRFNSRRFYGALRNISTRPAFVQAAKHAMRAVNWGNIIAGSLSKELKKVKGMDVILEFGQAVAALLEQVIDGQEAERTDT